MRQDRGAVSVSPAPTEPQAFRVCTDNRLLELGYGTLVFPAGRDAFLILGSPSSLGLLKWSEAA